jgi:radical SAM protein with 4Fe4S-binding SPASM domain
VKRGKFWGNIDFPIDLYVAIVNEGVDNGLCAVKYNILGEPLLHPQLVEMISIAKTLGVIDTLLNTNGSVLTDRYSTRIIASGLDKMFFSFDSPYRKTYNKIRIGANYDKVLYNIKRFMYLRNKLGSVTPFTRASMVLMEENKDEWDDFEKLFRPIVDTVGQSLFMKHSGQENDRTIQELGEKKKYCCPQLWQRMFVHSDGEVGVCCIDTSRTIKVGNVYDSSPKDIWLGSKYQEIREIHATGNFERIPACNECPMARF